MNTISRRNFLTSLALGVLAQAQTSAKDYYERGIAKEDKGDFDGAIADYNRAIELNPGDAKLYRRRGGAKGVKADWDEAIADLSHAIRLDPKDPMSYSIRGLTKLYKGEDLDGVIADCNHAIELNARYACAYDYRGSALVLQRRWTTALADFRRCCELISPRGQDYLRLKIWFIRARLDEGKAAHIELADYIEKRPKDMPDDWPRTIAGFLLNKTSETELIAAASSPDPKKDRDQHCSALCWAGMKRLLAGDKTAAADCFRKCLATEAKDCLEHHFAQAELKAMAAR